MTIWPTSVSQLAGIVEQLEAGRAARNMTRATGRADWGGIAFLTALYLAPVAIGPLFLQSSWRAIAIAYGIWLSVLVA
jgi:hypothetical protein